MKKIILATLLVLAPVSASASLDITSLTLDPSTAIPGQSVSVSSQVNRTGSGTANDWMSYKVSVNGSNVCTETGHALYPFDINNPYVGGAGTASSSSLFTAPGLDGLFDVVFRVYQQSGCVSLQDTATTTLTVSTPPVPPVSSSPSNPSSRSRGGRSRCVETTQGTYCPSAQAQAEYTSTHENVGAVLGISVESEIARIQAELEIYRKIVELMQQIEVLQG